ncbi:MAG TPA: hypothetical protein VM661_04410 [Candidatus Sulfotelmatobacter sp.]|jgi:hypothetical protein|nr:hypothetical protein [Candidatus Sulfotelmatobacter sp.]
MADYRHGLRLKTARISNIEDWLDRNAEGAWDIRLDEISEDLETKSYMIFFEQADDLAALKWALSYRGMPDRPDLPALGGKGASRRAAKVA